MAPTDDQTPPVEDQMPPEAAAELREWGGRILAIVFQSIPVPIILSIVVWQTYSRPLADLSCSFEVNRRMLSLWPANLNYILQLHDTDFTHADRCWFFAVNSTASALYLCWLVWVIGRCVFILRHMEHVSGTARHILPKILGGLLALAGVGLSTSAGLQLLIGFEPSRGLHGLSTLMPIGWSASKVVFFIMPYSYFAVGGACNLLFLLLRYLVYLAEEW